MKRKVKVSLLTKHLKDFMKNQKTIILLVSFTLLAFLPNLISFFTQLTSAQVDKPQIIAVKDKIVPPSSRIKKIISGAIKPKQIPDNVAYELFLRTVATGNARGLVSRAGFTDEQVEVIMSQAYTLNSILERSDKQARELKDKQTSSNENQTKTELLRLQEEKNVTLAKTVNRYLPSGLNNDAMLRLRDFIKTEVKGHIQKVFVTNNLSQTKEVAFVKTSATTQSNGGELYLYSTGWNDGVNVFGSGSLNEQYTSQTSYRVTISVTSPSGRSNTTEGDWNYATVIHDTGLSLGAEDGIYSIQANFEEQLGYYDEYGNFYGTGSSAAGSSTNFVDVPARISLVNVTVLPNSISRNQTASLLATLSYSAEVPNNTTLSMELIDAIISPAPHPTYTVGTPVITGGTGTSVNNNRTVTLIAPNQNGLNARSQQVTFPITITATTAGGTVNLSVVIASAVAPPPSPNPSIVPPANRDTTLTITATPTPTPTPNPTPTPRGGGGGCLSGFTASGEKYKEGDSNDICSPCNPSPSELQECANIGGNYDWVSCNCGASPIVLDIDGDGFDLTNAQNGILFDIIGRGSAYQVAWTSANSDDAWLVLDRNQNNRIDSGEELFGDNSEQPAGQNPRQGFASLGMFDAATRGGNGDGKITRRDLVFRKLRLWQDRNHNGVSEPEELFRLPALDVVAVSLDYRQSRCRDEHGNWFKYRAKVRDRQNAQVGRWAWDVFLVLGTR